MGGGRAGRAADAARARAAPARRRWRARVRFRARRPCGLAPRSVRGRRPRARRRAARHERLRLALGAAADAVVRPLRHAEPVPPDQRRCAPDAASAGQRERTGAQRFDPRRRRALQRGARWPADAAAPLAGRARALAILFAVLQKLSATRAPCPPVDAISPQSRADFRRFPVTLRYLSRPVRAACSVRTDVPSMPARQRRA
ncbi:protein of unknown function [Burkholderia multivorans]